ncbi:hypothetical protein SCHPADRAFT_812650, partial [Schizopora paradoxa]
TLPDLYEWHRRFGHLGYDNLKKLHSQALVTGMKVDNSSPSYTQPGDCSHCHAGKMHREPFERSDTVIDVVLGLVHSDLIGDIKPPSTRGYRYVMTFID